ncbi:hypothetical protein ACLB6G_20335 [Zhengella sp. ZM62]|uniref:hypothetical protein n=1 Tax=Zhengella sedimenti TaxID=3390035 RepID=UPI0039757849
MGFDLSAFDEGKKKQEEGIPVPIKHPATGEETGIVITVASYESERVKAVAREIANRALADQKKNSRKVDTVEAIEDRTFAIALASIVGWSGLEKDGKELPFTRDNARMILEAYPFIAEQIDAAAQDRALFFGN